MIVLRAATFEQRRPRTDKHNRRRATAQTAHSTTGSLTFHAAEAGHGLLVAAKGAEAVGDARFERRERACADERCVTEQASGSMPIMSSMKAAKAQIRWQKTSKQAMSLTGLHLPDGLQADAAIAAVQRLHQHERSACARASDKASTNKSQKSEWNSQHKAAPAPHPRCSRSRQRKRQS